MIEFPLRPRHDLCSDWDFVRGKVGKHWLAGHDEGTEIVDLPHCWNTVDTYQYGVKSYRGLGAYRREVQFPETETGGTWYLRSDGFYGIGDLWLDGRRMCRFDAQYLGLDIALPASIAHGSHFLAIRLDNRFHRNVLPGRKDPDFLLYGGLAGGLWLEQRPWPRFDARSTEIRCRTDRTGSELVELRTFVSSPHGAAAGGRLSWTIATEEGEIIARAEPVATDGPTTATATITRPRIWTPDHPHLYWAEGHLTSARGVTDTMRIRFGITRAEIQPDRGFFLDGERTDLHGVNRHESMPGFGAALPIGFHRSDAQLLKSYGCNFVRLSHYPQHPVFLDACDELGIMVYAEIASWKSVRSSPGWRRAARQQMRDLISRDRHHPSVVVWGMGNESRSRKAFLELREIARELDPSRPVTYAENHLYRAKRNKITGIPDVWGVNYELDALEEARGSSRLGVVVLSECCNHPTSVRGLEHEELAQVAVIEREWEVMADQAGLAGFAVWSFTDYATEYRNRSRRQTGLFDAWRRPKMAAELFRARYSREPLVALFVVSTPFEGPPSRFRKELSDPPVDPEAQVLHLFSNCDRVHIDQGDSELASCAGALHYVVPVDLARGGLLAVGRFASGDVTQRLDPHAEATGIKLKISDEFPHAGDTRAFDVTVVDADGAPVRNWNGHVRAFIVGRARLHSYTPSNQVLVSRGEGRLFATVFPGDRDATLTVSADGLEPGRLSVGPAERSG